MITLTADFSSQIWRWRRRKKLYL